MGLFDSHAGLLDAYRDFRTTGADPFQIRMEGVLSPTEAIIDGKKGLLVGTNIYVGLYHSRSAQLLSVTVRRTRGLAGKVLRSVQGAMRGLPKIITAARR